MESGKRVISLDSIRAITAAACLAVLSGCGSGKQQAPPPPSVTVNRAIEREIVEWDEYPGRLESPKTVTISARVSGIIEQAPFIEGSVVAAGDILFVLDARPFAAELKSREADVQKAQSQLALAEAHLHRYEKLKGTRAITEEEYDEAAAALQQARAGLGGAQAARDIAKLNLEWTKVTAPISGRIGRKQVTEGNLINGGTAQATALTSITSIDPLYSYVSVPERLFLEYQGLDPATKVDGRIPAYIKLETEKEYRRRGYVDFIDNRVNAATGTVEIRAVVPNPNGDLAAGLFSRLRVPGSNAYRAVLVPDAAVGTNQESRFLLVVNKDNVVEQRAVTLGPRLGSLRVITAGLAADERFVIIGMQQARPGAAVAAQEASIDEATLIPYLSSTARATPATTAERAG